MYLVSLVGYILCFFLALLMLHFIFRKSLFRKKALCVFLGVWILATLLSGSYIYHFNLAPRDHFMINNFNENKAVFRDIVQHIEANPIQGDIYSGKSINALKEEIHVKYVSVKLGYIWLPDPYSEEVAQINDAKSRKREALGNQFKNENKVVFLELRNHFEFDYRSGRHIGKVYIRYPAPPRIVDGELWLPFAGDKKPYKKHKVVNDLDGSVWGWERGECRVKKLDDHWFIRLCNSWE